MRDSLHHALGLGLLGTVYETRLLHELGKTRLDVRRQVAVLFVYDGVQFDDGLKIDILFGRGRGWSSKRQNKTAYTFDAASQISEAH